MKPFSSVLILVHAFCTLQCFVTHGDSAAPAKVSTLVFAKEGDQACPPSQVLSVGRQTLRDEIQVALAIDVEQFNCSCGGPGPWRRIAHLNMTDPNQQCPDNWNLTSTPVRGCGQSSTTGPACDSAIFPSNGQQYSRICGQVIGYQKGSPDAFESSIRRGANLETVYIDGVSITHGATGSRQHIWSFAAAFGETVSSSFSQYICSCTDTNVNWPYQAPSFVENNYFCATGNRGFVPTNKMIVYPDDPLWDGEGCGPNSACCQFNNPPWFCTTLPQPTTDDLELRICRDQGTDEEDIIISLVEIAVM